MFDIGWQELFIVAILGIIVIGPKDLPRAIRTVTQAIRKLRGLASDFQSSLDEVAREAELDDIRREFNKAGQYDVTQDIKDSLDPTGDLEKAADIDGTVREAMVETKQAADSATDPAGSSATKVEETPAAPEPATETATEPATETADSGDGSAKQVNG